MKFTKMHGLGNDYVYVNCFEQELQDAASLAVRVSDRHRGIGSDGLILITPSKTGDVRMIMYNADGSRGRMCGNGIRCVAKYAYEHGLSRNNPMVIETDDGIKVLRLNIEGGRVASACVDMGTPRFKPREIPVHVEGDRVVDHAMVLAGEPLSVTCVSMGNPHAVLFGSRWTVDDLLRIGPALERHSLFPDRTNVELCCVISPGELEIHVWERGSGVTMACGTGACAAVVAGIVTQRLDRNVTARLPGGELEIIWDGEGSSVFMVGPAEEVFEGTWNWD